MNRVADDLIDWQIFDTRATNALRSWGLRTWGELGSLNDAALLRIPSIGELTVRRVHQALRGYLPSSMSPSSTHEASLGERTPPTGRRLLAAARWATEAADANASLREVLDLFAEADDIPHDAAHDIHSLLATRFASLAGVESSLWAACADLVAEVPHLEMLLARECETPRPSFAALGGATNMTGEGARRRVMTASSQIRRLLETPRYRVVKRAIHEFQAEVGLVAPRHSDLIAGWVSRVDPSAFEILRWAAGYTYDGHWVIESSARTQLARAVDAATAATSHDWLFCTDALFDALGEPPDRGVVVDFLQETLRWRDIGDGWLVRWDGTLADKAAKVLSLVGRPMTPQELVNAMSEGTVNSLRNGRGTLVPIDKQFRLALPEWGHKPYLGIVEAIKDTIDRRGGAASRAALLDELPERFGVTAASVETNLKQLLTFDVQEDVVRMNNTPLFEARSPDTITDAAHTQHGWGQWRRVSERHLKGYPFHLSAHIAWANGIRPGDKLRVPLNGSTQQVSVIWRTTAPVGRIEVGRVRNWLKQQAVPAGALLLVCPTPTGVTIRQGGPDDAAERSSCPEPDAVVGDAS